MRTLLVDNYDSFTYNLFHYLAEINGSEPEVVLNDDPRWRPEHRVFFDNVVLSPGPGHPGRDTDFGICRDLIHAGDVPLLGVCLGHQGLAEAYGGEVSRAPEPFHGRSSTIRHDGLDLFDGLPGAFPVARYHSLAVSRVPDALAETAWTADGLVMGLRHRRLPQWGVQFHPESVGGRHGRAILANFRDLTVSRGRPRRRTGPSPAAPAPSARPARRRLRVLTRTVPAGCDGEVAYAELFQGRDHAYWLDSSRPEGETGRFSIMGDATGPLARVVRADVVAGTLTVRSARGTRVFDGELLRWLADDLAATRIDDPGLPGGFALGWVGYLGYELKAECGARLTHPAEDPDAVLVFADRAVLIDHQQRVMHLLALVEDGAEAAAREWLAGTEARLATLAGTRLPAPEAPPPLPELRARHERTEYLDLIERSQAEIAAGESYEICLTNQIETDGSLRVWPVYRYLRRESPAWFGALLEFGDINVLSTSPERFLRVDADGVVESRPIKGTRPRGATPAEDDALAAELATDVKDRAENLMIVDLVRNDLGRCSRIGSVTADDLFRVETHPLAHQLVSTVTGRLRPDSTAVDCVRASFPPGSMTGAPKTRTMEILDRLEGGPRGVYAGAIGYFSLTGAADLSVVIRTVVVAGDRVRYGVGGAITALSDPAAEVAETVVKAAVLRAVAGRHTPLLGVLAGSEPAS
ncbi:aminodeoxychorismate synthase component I [Actinoplanes philippinensis]|uniref:aminodeoxychorismate synthase component I n=1 Tax=Actinoplanes philippinensis TaxID=35752 RepID=UPI0033CD248C